MKKTLSMFISGLALFLMTSCGSHPDEKDREKKMTEQSAKASAESSVQHINPDGLIKNPAFTQVVAVNGPVKTVYVGGQDAVDASGQIVGKGDIKAQAEQVLKNMQIALEAGGAKLEDVIKWTVYSVQGQPPQPAFEVFQRIWGNRPNPPAITVVYVSGLAHPDFLMELEAIAVVKP